MFFRELTWKKTPGVGELTVKRKLHGGNCEIYEIHHSSESRS